MRETVKRRITQYLSINGKVADWVHETKRSMKKSNVTFTVKFLWLIVCHYLSPTGTDNNVIWDCAVLLAAMITGFEVEFLWLL